MKGGRDEGREGWREGGMKGGRDEGGEGWREGGMKGGWEGGEKGKVVRDRERESKRSAEGKKVKKKKPLERKAIKDKNPATYICCSYPVHIIMMYINQEMFNTKM